eukprot:Protomagalhaensia_sp_Gyna_25__927@NODE_1447_length_1827_cov_449_564318_g1171_i0_p1_GENE_NODE_1447_length_1827_cov_449_564318_g1171_i0NODE_1447_length_1827_cov_449_564318_g1171_i0_p1_ORF_typecomplete_len207_score24_73HOOK/PF05622_12/0_0001Dor1/PF04124_12/0_00017Tht1/PF04163_12/0_00028LRRFIP/PF09738_9/0_00039Spc7/PF08317_11/0_0014KASH_CCD/PF14662_6/0_0016GAS/PF13851_6/0_0023HAUS5/PF14817_6/0_002MAD/PF05557_13/0_002DUF4200/PF13863_6/0_0025SLX9/PF15341_6/0_0028PI3K_P85_iSH2/PF16454_5/0_0035CENPF_leu
MASIASLKSAANTDVTTAFKKALNDHADFDRVQEHRRLRLQRDNAKLEQDLEALTRSISETQIHVATHTKTVEQQRRSNEVMSQQIQALQAEIEEFNAVIQTCKRDMAASCRAQEESSELLSGILGVKLLTHEDGKKCILLDRIIPKRENVSCCISCVNHESRVTVIPRRIDPEFPGFFQTLKKMQIEDLHVCCFISRLLFKAAML